MSLADRLDIVVVSTGLLEAGTRRGGGTEEIDQNVARALSRSLRVAIMGPYYGVYGGRLALGPRLCHLQVRFPAVKDYPPRSEHDLYYYTLLEFMYLFPFVANLVRSSIRFKPRVLIVHAGLAGLAGSLVGKIFGAKILYSEGNTYPWFSPHVVSRPSSVVQRLMFIKILVSSRLLAKVSDCIRVQSKSIGNGMVRYGIPASKTSVIPGGVDVDSFAAISGRDTKDKPVVAGYIGRLSEEKGAALLLETIQAASQNLPTVRFVILGNGPYQERLLGFSSVDYIGWVGRDEIKSWLEKMDIVMFFQKDIGLAELQAMASGKVIVACGVGEVPTILTHMADSILCEPTAMSYVDSLRLCAGDAQLRERLSRNAISTARQRFSWEVVDEMWLSLCWRLLQNPTSSENTRFD